LTRTFRPDLRPVWLPDGRAIAVVGEDDVRAPGRFQVIRVDVATGAETEIAALSQGGARHMGMTLGRDGTSLFINMSGTESGPPQVVKVALDSGEATPLTNDLAAYGSVSLAGDAIVTTRRQGSSGLWLSDAAARGPRQLGRDVPSLFNGLTWAGPARLLYQASLAGGVGVWSTSVEDGSSTLVVPGGAEVFASADGRTLVFTRSGRELWRADGDGGHATRVPDAVASGLGLTPDGSLVFYISTQSGKQVGWVADLAGGPPRPFTTMEVTSAPRVSPDGRYVVYFDLGTGGKAVIMPVSGGATVREVPIPRAPVRWTPDGRGLAYLDAARENISVQPIDAGAPRQLTAFTDQKQIRDFAWSPDGKQLAIVRSVSTSDIVLLKGVR
jgi:Tol biopolymer transport system component